MNPGPVTLEGRVVRVEPLEQRHAEALLEAAGDPAIWRYLPMAQPLTLEAVRRWIEETAAQAAGGEQVPFAIVRRDTGRAVGSTRFLEIHRDWRGLEIGWTWLAAAAQRTAVNTECKLLLLRHAFEDLGALRVQFKTDLRNLQSQQALERLGAVREGVLRKSRINHDGYVRSSVYFSVLDDEWPALRQRLEARLEAGLAASREPPREAAAS
jgi:RimJ/RimL family protein N-acetyltransferase